MAAEFIGIHLVTRRGKLLDWAAGHRRIDQLSPTNRAWGRIGREGDAIADLAAARRVLHAALAQLNEAISEPFAYFNSFDLGQHTIYYTGGDSWGDAPNDAFQAACSLPDTVLRTIGFKT